jgi:hypothetical protein
LHHQTLLPKRATNMVPTNSHFTDDRVNNSGNVQCEC